MESIQYAGFAYELSDVDKSKEQPHKLASSETSCMEMDKNVWKNSSPSLLLRKDRQPADLL